MNKEVCAQLERILIVKSILPINELTALIEDMESLIYQFANICDVEHVRVHLKTVSNDACQNFASMAMTSYCFARMPVQVPN